MQSKNLSIMLTDLQGYTAKSTNASRESLADLIRTHTNLLVPVIQFYKGRIIKGMGDSFLCVFESATDAAICSIAIQMILGEFNRHQRSEEKRLNVRVIINSGDVTLDSNDIFGEPVNLVSRMEKMPEFAEGGIGLSESTYLLMNRREIVADLMGEFQFKGIHHPIKVYRLDLAKQKLDRLPTKLFELVKQVASGKQLDIDWLPNPAQTPRKHSNLLAAGIAAATLLIVLATFLFFRGRDRQELRAGRNMMRIIHESDPTHQRDIAAKDFKGTPVLFKSIDANADGILSRQEIRKWMESHFPDAHPPGPDSSDSPTP